MIIVKYETTDNAQPQSRAIFDYADALRQVGRRQEAVKSFDKLVSLPMPDSKRWLVFLYKGQTLMDMGRFDDAILEFRQASELDTTTVPRVYLAKALAELEQFPQAVAVLEKALEKEGDHDEVYLNIALSQRALGQLIASRESVLKALTITTGYEPAKKLLEDLEAALAFSKGSDKGRGHA